MEQKEIIEGNKLIAQFLGWYYIGFNDLQGHPKAGWYRLVSKNKHSFPLAKQTGLSKVGDNTVQYKFRKHSDLRFFNEWDALMPVITYIQDKVDLKDVFYNFEIEGEIQYNFEGFEFTLYKGGGYSGVNLMLDPQMEIAKSFNPDLTWLQNTWIIVVETVKYINERRANG